MTELESVKVKKPLWTKWWFWVIVVIALWMIGSLVSDIETSEIQKDMSLEDLITSSIYKVTGEKARNTDKQRVIGINTIDDVIAGEGSKIVNVELNSDEHRTIARTRDDMLLYSAELFPELFKIDGVSEVSLMWNLPLTDASGNDTTRTVMTITIRADSNINWDKFDVYSFEKVANRYYEHDALR